MEPDPRLILASDIPTADRFRLRADFAQAVHGHGPALLSSEAIDADVADKLGSGYEPGDRVEVRTNHAGARSAGPGGEVWQQSAIVRSVGPKRVTVELRDGRVVTRRRSDVRRGA